MFARLARPGRWPLLVLFGLALLPRLAALSFNHWPHGDVLLDAAVVDSLALRGELKVPLVDVRFFPTERFGFGYPPDQHPPLWPLLGAALRTFWPASYEALKIASFLAGALLLPAVYRLGADLFGAGPGLFAAALCGLSYLLIDFAGNGSLWSLLALLYVLFVWRAACFPLASRPNAVLLGVLMGAAYLINYPAVVLPLTLALLWASERLRPPPRAGEHSVQDGRAAPLARTACPSPAAGYLLAFGVAGLLVLPWLVHNLALFGNPIWSQPLQRQLGGGDKQVEVIVTEAGIVKQTLASADPAAERLRTTALNLYGNLGFLVRQSFVLTPFLGGFAAAGLALLTARCLTGGPLAERPLLLLTLLHGGLILLWPTTKFRYLVPLFPLVVLIGAWLLWQVKPNNLRGLLAAVALGSAAFTSAWTFASIPSHTYYYDGGPVEDNFGAQGEIAYVEDQRRLQRAAEAIPAGEAGALLAPHALYRANGRPLVVNSAVFSREVVEYLVRRYQVAYVVAEREREPFYAGFLPGGVIWADDRYLVWSLR